MPKRGRILLACALVVACAAESSPRSSPSSATGGVVTTALLSFPDFFCALTELSEPYAFIGFALQIEGRIRYYKTPTTGCAQFKRSRSEPGGFPTHLPMFGEQVTLYGGPEPTRLRRENGDTHPIEPSECSTTRSFFSFSPTLPVHVNPKEIAENPHPELVLLECRQLTDTQERDLCLFYQAGLQNQPAICEEISGRMREECDLWLENIRLGRLDR
jgi:hypothetical protein